MYRCISKQWWDVRTRPDLPSLDHFCRVRLPPLTTPWSYSSVPSSPTPRRRNSCSTDSPHVSFATVLIQRPFSLLHGRRIMCCPPWQRYASRAISRYCLHAVLKHGSLILVLLDPLLRVFPLSSLVLEHRAHLRFEFPPPTLAP